MALGPFMCMKLPSLSSTLGYGSGKTFSSSIEAEDYYRYQSYSSDMQGVNIKSEPNNDEDYDIEDMSKNNYKDVGASYTSEANVFNKHYRTDDLFIKIPLFNEDSEEEEDDDETLAPADLSLSALTSQSALLDGDSNSNHQDEACDLSLNSSMTSTPAMASPPSSTPSPPGGAMSYSPPVRSSPSQLMMNHTVLSKPLCPVSQKQASHPQHYDYPSHQFNPPPYGHKHSPVPMYAAQNSLPTFPAYGQNALPMCNAPTAANNGPMFFQHPGHQLPHFPRRQTSLNPIHLHVSLQMKFFSSFLEGIC